MFIVSVFSLLDLEWQHNHFTICISVFRITDCRVLNCYATQLSVSSLVSIFSLKGACNEIKARVLGRILLFVTLANTWAMFFVIYGHINRQSLSFNTMAAADLLVIVCIFWIEVQAKTSLKLQIVVVLEALYSWVMTSRWTSLTRYSPCCMAYLNVSSIQSPQQPCNCLASWWGATPTPPTGLERTNLWRTPIAPLRGSFERCWCLGFTVCLWRPFYPTVQPTPTLTVNVREKMEEIRHMFYEGDSALQHQETLAMGASTVALKSTNSARRPSVPVYIHKDAPTVLSHHQLGMLAGHSKHTLKLIPLNFLEVHCVILPSSKVVSLFGLWVVRSENSSI